jgi:D-lactate dehydrogenase
MKVAFFELRKNEEESIRSCMGEGHELSFYKEPLSAGIAGKVEDCACISVINCPGGKLDAEMLQKLPSLNLIAVRATGFDPVDLAECRNRKITVCNVPFYAENTVAEHTFALMLSLSRNVHKAYVKVMEGKFGMGDLEGFDLRGKTLGVVGAGRIGLHTIRIARAFSMKVLVFDVRQDGFMAETLGFEYVPMDRLLQESDIITLHAPYNAHTHHMIDAAAIGKMNKGVIIINTARGGLIDTDALMDALDSGQVAGAGLDVIEGEEMLKEDAALLDDGSMMKKLAKLVKGDLLHGMHNVVYTPHIAFYSREAFARNVSTTCENIRAFAEGKPQNVVS